MKNRVKEYRKAEGLNQTELANMVGCSRITITSIERNKSNPNVILALKLADYFKIKVENLFQLEEGDL